MAQFLTTRGISSQLEEILIGAESFLYILSPYLKFSNTLYERLSETTKRGIDSNIICREHQNLSAHDERLLLDLHCNVFFKKDLHAKCYVNEHVALIASMNLYTEFVKTLSEYAIDGDDLYALENEKVQKVFTTDELQTLEERVLTELVPNLSEVRKNVERNFLSSDDTAEEYMERFIDLLKTLQTQLGSNDGVITTVEKEILKAKDWIVENTKEEEPGIAPRKLDSVREADSYQNVRSIFDDVDD